MAKDKELGTEQATHGWRGDDCFTPTRKLALATVALAGDYSHYLPLYEFVARLTGASREQVHLDVLSMVGHDGEKGELRFRQDFVLELTEDKLANEVANAEVIPLDAEREIGRSVLADLVERTITLEQDIRAITDQ